MPSYRAAGLRSAQVNRLGEPVATFGEGFLHSFARIPADEKFTGESRASVLGTSRSTFFEQRVGRPR
jgi:hypothetical protein